MSEENNWISKVRIDPLNDFGFVYVIASNENTKKEWYVGAKQFKKKVGKKYKESDWKTYTSSSKKLNELISERGKDKFNFLIIDVAKKHRTELKWKEMIAQIKMDCMFHPNCLNQLIQVRINRKALNK